MENVFIIRGHAPIGRSDIVKRTGTKDASSGMLEKIHQDPGLRKVRTQGFVVPAFMWEDEDFISLLREVSGRIKDVNHALYKEWSDKTQDLEDTWNRADGPDDTTQYRIL